MSLLGGSKIGAGGFYLSLAIAMMLVGGLLIQAVPTASAAPTAKVLRSFDGIERCGQTLNVTLSINWNDAQLVAIEEKPPENWEVESVQGGNEKDGTVKFVHFEGSPKKVHYTISVPNGTRGPAEYFGTYRDNTMSSDEGDAVIQGTQKVEIACDPATTGTVTRSLPAEVTCGQEIEVNLTIDAPDGNEAWIVDERTPLDPISVDERDHGDSVDGHVKWVATDGGSGYRNFSVKIPGDATEGATFIFRGEYLFDPSMVDRAPVEGDNTVRVTQCENPTPDEEEDNASKEKAPRRPARSEDRSDALPKPDDEVEAAEADSPEGARASYTATVTARAGQGVTILLDSDLVPSLDLYPSADLTEADVSVTLWDQGPPPDVTSLPAGVLPALYVDVTVDGQASDHTAVFNLKIPGQSILGEINQTVLAKFVDGSWQGLSAVDLSETPDPDGAHTGTVQAPCCSIFMVGSDLISPTITMETTRSGSDTIEVATEPSDNLAILQVDILVDDEVVATLEEAPYTTEISLDGLEAGDHTITAVAYDLTERYDEASQTATIQGAVGVDVSSGLLWGLIVLAGIGAVGMVVASDPDRRAAAKSKLQATTTRLREAGTRLPWVTPAPTEPAEPPEEAVEPGPPAEEVDAPEPAPATDAEDDIAGEVDEPEEDLQEDLDAEAEDEASDQDTEDPATDEQAEPEDQDEDLADLPPPPVTAEGDQAAEEDPSEEDPDEGAAEDATAEDEDDEASREERKEDLRAMLEGLSSDR